MLQADGIMEIGIGGKADGNGFSCAFNAPLPPSHLLRGSGLASTQVYLCNILQRCSWAPDCARLCIPIDIRRKLLDKVIALER